MTDISMYWDMGSNITYVMMKYINEFILWWLKYTMKYNDIYNTLTIFFYDKWHTDLQQCSGDKWIDNSYEIYLPYSDIPASPAFSVVSFIISYMQKEYIKWCNSKHIYVFYIYNYRYHHTIICCIYVEHIIYTSPSYLLR